MGEAVAAFLRERGQDEVERLYRVINDIIEELDPAPGDALRDLAAIYDLRLFVSTTPDRLLAQAVNEVRFQGRPATRELSFSPNQSTSEQSRNAQAGCDNRNRRSQSVWSSRLHAPVRDPRGGPAGVAARVAQRRGEPSRLACLSAEASADAVHWLRDSRLDRAVSPAYVEQTRLSLERNQFFFVGSSTSHEPSLSNFFATYCRKTLVQQLEMEPAAFVAELRARWEEQSAARPHAAVDTISPLLLLLQTRRRSSSATCVRMWTLPGGCATRSRVSAGTCGWTSGG